MKACFEILTITAGDWPQDHSGAVRELKRHRSVFDRSQSRPLLIASAPIKRPTPKAIPMAGYGCVRTALSAVLAAATVFSSRRSQAALAFSMALSFFARMFVFSLSSVDIAFILASFLLVLSYVSATIACRVPLVILEFAVQRRLQSSQWACGSRITGSWARVEIVG